MFKTKHVNQNGGARFHVLNSSGEVLTAKTVNAKGDVAVTVSDGYGGKIAEAFQFSFDDLMTWHQQQEGNDMFENILTGAVVHLIEHAINVVFLDQNGDEQSMPSSDFFQTHKEACAPVIEPPKAPAKKLFGN